MEKITSTIHINAPKEKVWHTMLDDPTYREWTKIFNKDSHYEGNWEKGSRMVFLGCNEDGTTGGMVSTIEENRPYEFLSIKHLGMINNGVEDTTSDEVKKWTGIHENYTLREVNGGTEVLIELDIEAEYKEMFVKLWSDALDKLKEIAERQS